MPGTRGSRPLPVLVSAAATLAVAVFVLGVGVVSLTAGHGAFSGGVAAALLGWAALVAAVGWLFGRGVGLTRGPVVAMGLLHLFSFGQMVPGTPWLAIPALLALVAAVGAVLPATNRWLTAT